MELINQNQIIEKSISYDSIKKIGIYFLIKDKQIIYIGQSINIHNRLSHHSSRKQFDAISIIECNPDNLDELESLYIHAIKPCLNGNGKKGEKNAPFNRRELRIE